MLEALHALSTAQLKALAILLRQPGAATALPLHLLQQVVGMQAGQHVEPLLRRLSLDGWSAEQVATVLDTVAAAREQPDGRQDHFDLVLSGPELPGVRTRDTAAVLHGLFSEAKELVLLVGFAVYRGERLFAPLAERWAANTSMSIRFCLDVPRPRGDTSLPSEILGRFLATFESDHWPWKPLPELYYDPRSLEPAGSTRSSLHAKCVVVDRRVAFVTSANFTEAAQERNIECGLIVRHPSIAERLADYFDALIDCRQLIPLHS